MLRVLCLLAASAVLGASGAAAAFQRVSLGDRLERDVTSYNAMPINATAATAAGWVPLNGGACQPGYGQLWAESAAGPTTDKPLTLFFTPAGQVSGMSVLLTGSQPQNLLDKGYFEQMGEYSMMTVTFRDPADVCANTLLSEPIGDRLIINANGIAEEVPLTTSDAAAAGWIRGACITNMGTHWIKDLTGNSMTWQAANMLPLVTMYDELGTKSNTIQAWFFATPVVQQRLLASNMWDGIPIPDFLMCNNFCDSACTFHDTSFFSTMHIYTRDHTTAVCNKGCSIGCCPNSAPNPLAKLLRD